MEIDLEHLHYWMCAIRESADPKRTLDAFWQGQLKSKEWLITSLEKFLLSQKTFLENPINIDIHGGWVGVLSSMLFQSSIPIRNIRSIDIDPSCQTIATTMNKKEEMLGRFQAITADMCCVKSTAEVIINTSCEHITQSQYDLWLKELPENSILVLQSNNYKIEEHVRIANSLEEFKKQSRIKILWSDQLDLPLYKRFMIIGKK